MVLCDQSRYSHSSTSGCRQQRGRVVVGKAVTENWEKRPWVMCAIQHTLEILIVPALTSYTNHQSKPSTLQLPYSSLYLNPLHSSLIPISPQTSTYHTQVPLYSNTLPFRWACHLLLIDHHTPCIWTSSLFRYLLISGLGVKGGTVKEIVGGRNYDGGEWSWMLTL